MRQKLQNRKQEGFTIIEVLIVLAIAGLIMIVVFMAVPALQRNQRNSEVRTSANNFLGAAQEVSSNNGGKPLTTSANGAGDAKLVFDAGNGTKSSVETLRIETPPTGNTAAPTAAADVSTKSVIIRVGKKCQAENSGVTPDGTGRQIALIFYVETTSSTPQVQCINS